MRLVGGKILKEQGKGVIKTVGFMMAITLLGKVLGLVRDQLMAIHYAIGMEADAFLTASQIPRVFFDAVFASAISASFIPIFNEYMQKKGKEEAFRLSNQFITIIGIVTIALTLVGMTAARPLVNLFANQFDAPTTALSVELLCILFPAVFFTGIAFSFVGILQSLDEFGIPAAMSIASNVVIIFYYLFLNEKYGIYGLAVAFLIGWAMQAIIQVPALRKKGYHYRPCFQFREEGLKKIGLLMLPVMVSTWIQPINLMINTRFASGIFEGAIAVVGYANTLYSIVVGVFVLSVANVIFPRLSRMAEEKTGDFESTLATTLRAMAFLLLPMMFGLMTLSEPIVRLMYQWGDFDAVATSYTANALFFFSLGMIGFGVQTILSRAFYAEQDGKTPFYSGLASIGVNYLLCRLLVKSMGVGGLALASAISSTVSALLLLVPMQRKKKGIITPIFLRDLCKILCSAGIMAILVVLLKNTMEQMVLDGLVGRIITVCIPAGVGAVFYMILTYVMKLQESTMVFHFIGKVLGKGLKK
jgi:putative peptidoglycan lipid II flippase